MYDNFENLLSKEKVKHSGEQLQSFFDLASDGIFEINFDGKIQSINRRLLLMLGYSEEQVVGHKITDVIAQDDLGRVLHDFEQYRQWPFEWISEWSLKKKNGQFLPVEISAKIYPDSVVRGLVRDISVRKKQEQRNQILADLGRTLGGTTDYQNRIQLVADLLIPTLADVCIVSILEEGSLNFKAVGARDNSIREAIHNLGSHVSSGEEYRLSVPEVVNTKKSILVEDVELEMSSHPDFFGSKLRDRLQRFQVKSYVVLPMICRENVIGALTFYSLDSRRKFSGEDVGFFETIAARCATGIDNAKLYAEAQQCAKAREIVLSIVSHDLRNPLSVIDLSAQMLMDESFMSTHSLDSVMKRIRKSVLIMQQMISDLLDFSKAQAGTFTIEKKMVAINSLIFSSLEGVADRAQLKGQKIVVKCRDEGRSILADERRITQVLWNLVGNAIKFTPQGGEIVVEVSVTTENLKVSVLDSGPGLRENELSKVFTQFWQAEKTAELGTGLGLSIAKGIIEAHKGKIWVDCREQGGCQFTFTIPF